jgi:hypothetical protein
MQCKVQGHRRFVLRAVSVCCQGSTVAAMTKRLSYVLPGWQQQTKVAEILLSKQKPPSRGCSQSPLLGSLVQSILSLSLLGRGPEKGLLSTELMLLSTTFSPTRILNGSKRDDKRRRYRAIGRVFPWGLTAGKGYIMAQTSCPLHILIRAPVQGNSTQVALPWEKYHHSLLCLWGFLIFQEYVELTEKAVLETEETDVYELITKIVKDWCSSQKGC